MKFTCVGTSCVCVSARSVVSSFFDPVDCSQLGSFVQGIFQASILEWVAISFSRASSWPRDQTRASCVSHISRRILYHCTTWKALWWNFKCMFLGNQVLQVYSSKNSIPLIHIPPPCSSAFHFVCKINIIHVHMQCMYFGSRHIGFNLVGLQELFQGV